MPAQKISDQHFTEVWTRLRSPAKVAREIGITVRNVYRRRNSLMEKGIVLPTVPEDSQKEYFNLDTAAKMHFERRRDIEIKNGSVIVFSDPHFYPDANRTAQNALLEVIAEIKPKAVLCGGDALDGTQISRYDPTRGWHQPPSLAEQLLCMTERMTEIKKAAKGAITLMTLGNHDARLSRYLAVNAPHMEKLPGTSLEDYIPSWALSWTVRINVNTVLRHRNQAGMLHLQAQKAGCHYVHGHLHRLNVHAVAQYNGYLFSVDCGSFADPLSDAFDYAEDGPPHVQGFAVLTYRNGELLWPELCYIKDGEAFFRGQKL
jgi:UDP-2,3-diacylglucosamine pyrophosphatase LpxH